MNTGIKDLDKIMKINKKDLVIIASRPAMGKTTFALNVLNHIALEEKKSVLFFSLENTKETIVNKLLISNSMVVDLEKFELYSKYKTKEIEKTELSEDYWDRIAHGINLLKDSPIYIGNDIPYLINDICLEAKKLKEERNIEAIIIDYLQLIQFDKKRLLSREDEITEILRKLKMLAKELDVPIIITSQLSRKCENRINKRPLISDFSNSEYGISTYADKILFLYRDSYYDKNNKSDITELIVGKNNDGSIDTIKIVWSPEYCVFRNNKKNVELIPKKANESIEKKIEDICYNKAYELYGKILPKETKERLNLELNSIINNHFESIYLICSELVKYSNELGYEIGFRGSVGNSLVAYLLEITSIDPIQYNLPFEMFAGKNYDKKPKIDLYFSNKIQSKIVAYLEKKYGKVEINILENNDLTILHELEKETNISSKDIRLDDKETLKMFLHANNKSYPISTNGISEFEDGFAKKMVEIAKPRNFNDLVCISALSHGSGTWNYNAHTLVREDGKKIDEVISNREDMYHYLLNNGIDKNTAYDITLFITDGKALKGRSLWKLKIDEYKEFSDKWEEYKKILKEHNIPDWYIKDAEKIEYMFLKSRAIENTINEFKIGWYKVHYPKEFYKVYFKVKSDLKIQDYYCKRQVKTELNRLYDLKEIYENNQEFKYDKNTDNKINDLELILEMFNRGLLKEKEEINDDYNLINSRAIGDYCRRIKHEFNTEELAVLVYRNNRMSIEEKIKKYNDLIQNYSDMEVIERINCKYYKSVKTMIKQEIERLNLAYKKLTAKNDDSICTWTEYNKSTLQYDHRSDLKNTFKTYHEALKDIQDYIKEYNDTIYFQITKKYFGKKNQEIYADFTIKDKKAMLVNIKESGNCFLDIDNIFVNIPTPFKKGDILATDKNSARNYGDCDDIFVLDYLCNWNEDLERRLAKGNCDSSDMIGYGYYLYGEDTTEFVRDNKWDYDSFEYYEGKLTGNRRILKDISSFIKEKIGLELFVHAYDIYKTEFKNQMPDFYTDEGLKLAGMSDEDIEKINSHERKTYNLSKKKKEELLKNFTCIYPKFDKKEVKQIETDFEDNIYVLTNLGKLYKTREYKDDLEFLSENIIKIHYLDGINLYKITNENVILPIEENENWRNTDRYLNNNNCKYKKIETSLMHIVLLTEDGTIRALYGGYSSLGIMPDNFINVEDITILEDDNGIDMPYIYKNNKWQELYIN